MNEPIRILNLFTIMNRGGAETMVMNYYRAIDKSKIQFDFMVHRQERGAYEEEKEALDRKQQILMEWLGDHPALTITFFVPDEKKSGGAYMTKSGNLKKIDEFERVMLLTDGTKIPLDDVVEIESELFRDMF